MSRPLRIELAGGLFHVTSRGDRREAIYADDVDRTVWLDVFAEICDFCNWVCHAWCQMTNHYHFVVETPDANLARGMRQLNGIYTQAVNRRHRRVGHVYQGRYKAVLVERDSYLLELARYVVLNPVRAGMVADAGRWSWSSYGAMVGTQACPRWLQTDWILAHFGTLRSVAIHRYIDFVRAGVGLPSLWDNLQGQVYLGSEAFIARMRPQLEGQTIGEIPRAQRRPLVRPLADLTAGLPRDTAMACAFESGHYSLQQIAAHFGVHYATVSHALSRRRKPELSQCKT